MAAATVSSSAAHRHVNHLHTESLPLIDLHLLTQSELLSISLCSSSSSLHYLQNDADLFTPKIDRSVFNESAGSRKQTFSRLRLAPRNHNSQFSPSTPVPSRAPAEQVLDEENSQIISLLKSTFGANTNETEDNCDNADNNLVSVPIQYDEFLGFPSSRNEALQINAVTVGGGDYSSGETEMKEAISDPTSMKRKRGRPRKNEGNIYGNNNKNNNNLNQMMEIDDKEIEREVIAAGGEAEKEKERNEAMAVALASLEDPYGEELRRRTVGMHTKEELVGFLEGLGGEWLSKRKKKKIVDANKVGVGDVLPSGWKLTLCIKKKAAYFWIACRRYIRFLITIIIVVVVVVVC